MELPAGRNISVTPGRVQGSAASLRTTRAMSTDEGEEEEDTMEGDLGRSCRSWTRERKGGERAVVVI